MGFMNHFSERVCVCLSDTRKFEAVIGLPRPQMFWAAYTHYTDAPNWVTIRTRASTSTNTSTSTHMHTHTHTSTSTSTKTSNNLANMLLFLFC